jgi:hypothetical protein
MAARTEGRWVPSRGDGSGVEEKLAALERVTQPTQQQQGQLRALGFELMTGEQGQRHTELTVAWSRWPTTAPPPRPSLPADTGQALAQLEAIRAPTQYDQGRLAALASRRALLPTEQSRVDRLTTQWRSLVKAEVLGR